jgi:CCR4-NOT transcriptional regulation complex, NOT5 subunit
MTRRPTLNQRTISLLAFLALAVVIPAAAACSPSTNPSDDPTTPAATDTGTAEPTESASPTPTTTPTTLFEFTTDGAGPYQLGKGLNELQSNPGLEQVTPDANCPGNMTARGTGIWRDVVLHFRPDGRLYLAENRSLALPTPSGAYLGTTLEDLKKIYSGLVTEELKRGSIEAFYVQTFGGRGILFVLNSNKQVDVMYAADGPWLRNTFSTSDKLC